MATKKKIHYYVLVMTDNGPKFVTDTKGSDAYWNIDDKPLEMDKSYAEEVARGLTLNWHLAFVVAQPWEIESHPYNYQNWKIEWKERKEEE